MDTTDTPRDDEIVIRGERSAIEIIEDQRLLQAIGRMATLGDDACQALLMGENDEHTLNIQESRAELRRKSRKFYIRASYDSTQFRALRRQKRANKAANKRAKLVGARNRIQSKRLVKQSQQLFLQRSRKSASPMSRKGTVGCSRKSKR